MAAVSELLGRVPFLAVLPAGDRESLAAAARRRRFTRGQVVFHKGDPGESLFIIEEGSVRIYLPSLRGSDLTLALLGSGDYFGDLALLDGGPRSASAVATEATTTVMLERADFARLIGSRPESAMAVVAAVARQLRETDEMAADLAFLDVGGRLAKKLLELAAGHGVARGEAVMLDLPLTQDELASMLGVTRESVNRQLGRFRRLGLVGREGRRFLLLNPEQLRRQIT